MKIYKKINDAISVFQFTMPVYNKDSISYRKPNSAILFQKVKLHKAEFVNLLSSYIPHSLIYIIGGYTEANKKHLNQYIKGAS